MPEQAMKLHGPTHGSPASLLQPLMLLAASTASQLATDSVKFSKASPAPERIHSGLTWLSLTWPAAEVSLCQRLSGLTAQARSPCSSLARLAVLSLIYTQVRTLLRQARSCQREEEEGAKEEAPCPLPLHIT